MYGAKVSQAGFLVGYGPELAIDGDPNTCSLACGNCNGGTDRLGWWKVIFTVTYEMAAVELLSSRNALEGLELIYVVLCVCSWMFFLDFSAFSDLMMIVACSLCLLSKFCLKDWY